MTTTLAERPARNGSTPALPEHLPRPADIAVASPPAESSVTPAPVRQAAGGTPEREAERRRRFRWSRAQKPKLDEETAAVVAAQRFCWAWLAFATTISIGANFTHSWMTAPENIRVLASIMSLCPPIFLLGSTHHGVLLIKARRFGWPFVMSLMMTILLAALSFRLSYDAISSLVTMLGTAPQRAGIWPIINDLSIVNSTLGLFVLTRNRNKKRTAGGSTSTAGLRGWLAAKIAGPAEIDLAGLVDGSPMSAPERELWWHRVATVVKARNEHVKAVADRSADEIAEVLRLTFDDDVPQRKIVDMMPNVNHHRIVRAITNAGAEVLKRTAPEAAESSE